MQLEPEEIRYKHGTPVGYIRGQRLGWYYSHSEFWNFFGGLDKEVRIIDVGCGAGLVAHTLTMHGYLNIKLLDITDNRNKLLDGAINLPFLQVDLNHDSIPLKDGTVDVVISTNLIEHLENQHFFMREVHRVLKPGGRLILTMPYPWNIISRLLFLKSGCMESFYARNGHLTPMTVDIFNWMTRGFKEKTRFFGDRHMSGVKLLDTIIHHYPHNAFWSNRVGYLLLTYPGALPQVL